MGLDGLISLLRLSLYQNVFRSSSSSLNGSGSLSDDSNDDLRLGSNTDFLSLLIEVSAQAEVSTNPTTASANTQRNSAESESSAPVASPRSSAGPYAGYIQQAATQYNLDPKLLSRVIQTESDFDPNSVSPVGAIGLMQLMPETAKALGVTDPFDPAQNISGGAHFLRDMLDQFDGRVDLALAAYNAGPGAVHKYQGIPPYRETQAYVKRILGTSLDVRG